MGRPRDCDCRCLDVPPDCFGCTPPHEIPDTILFAGTSFNWSFPTEHHGTETSVGLFSGIYKEMLTDHNTYARPLSNINSAATLYRNPDGTCQWLWNDVRAMKTVWFCHKPTGALTEFEELSHYEPLNAIDSANPWNRVLLPVSDARCSTSGMKCTADISDATIVLLTPQRIIVTDAVNGYFTFATGPADGVWYWVLSISVIIGRSSVSTGLGATVAGPATGQSASFGCANAVRYSLATPIVTSDTSWIAGSTPPYRYHASYGGYFPTGGGMLYYIKEIDCVNDIGTGSTLTLTRAKQSVSFGARPADWGISYPASVQIQLPAS